MATPIPQMFLRSSAVPKCVSLKLAPSIALCARPMESAVVRSRNQRPPAAGAMSRLDRAHGWTATFSEGQATAICFAFFTWQRRSSTQNQ